LKSNTLRHIFIFDFKENVFDDALTTSAIILLAKDNNNEKVHFSTIKDMKQLNKIPNIIKDYPNNNGEITINKKELNPNIKWRIYYQEQQSKKYKNLIPFKSVAKVVRGIATGANDYFVFNKNKALKFNIEANNLLPCITKSKDIKNPFFTKDDFENLEHKNSNIYLFNAGKYPTNKNILNYIKMGENKEIHKKYLTSKRNPWYSLENRQPSPIWVGVFNRNGIKFIRNETKLSNLTTFHCIYLVNNLFYDIDIDLFFAYLLTDVAKQILNDNRREYGNGLKKFEPNDLNNASILDLSILSRENKEKVINLYNKYRKSVINNKEEILHINKIDELLKIEYGA
jgi:adenine-specific DNA-methyltransferase